MRGFTPALAVSLAGAVLMIGAAAAWITTPPATRAYHARPAPPVVITLANPAPAPVSFAASDLPIAVLTRRGGQAT